MDILIKDAPQAKRNSLCFRAQKEPSLVLSPSSRLFSPLPVLSQAQLLLPASCFLCSLYPIFHRDIPPLSRLFKSSNLQVSLEMPHFSGALPRCPSLTVFPAPTLSPTPGTLLSGPAAPGFLCYSSSWTVSTPEQDQVLQRTQGAFPRWERDPTPAKGKNGRNAVIHSYVR